MKVVFLDIDGVLQPHANKNRFQHINEIDAIVGDLNEKFPQYADWQQFTEKAGQYDITAVMYDWDQGAVDRLRHVLDTTGAKIVLSTDWRYKDTPMMKALLALHGLDKYLVGSTYFIKDYNVGYGDDDYKERYERVAKNRAAYRQFKAYMQKCFDEAYPPKEDEEYSWKLIQVDERAIEIREYLDRHPEVTSYITIDDRDLSYGLDGHAVVTRRDVFLPENEAEALSILMKADGPYPLPEQCRTPVLDQWRTDWLADFERQEADCYPKA